MTNTTISPFVVGEAQEIELTNDQGEKKKYWRKEILPSGTRKYKGQTLDFTRINPACVKAFDEGAFDAVPFVLALADNKHPEAGQEAKNLEGDLTKLEMSKEGSLFGYFDLSSDVVKTIQKSNHKFGVSGRIEVGYKAQDTGKEYDYALSHVCGTTRPHIKGMKPWESVELSEAEKQDTIDFSTEVIEAPTSEIKEPGDDLVAVNIAKDDLDKLLAFIGDINKADELVNKFQEGDKTPVAPAQLSEEATKRIELAEASAKSAFELAEKAQQEAAVTRWEAQKRDLALAGVPPVMLTEAEPIMRLYKAPSIQLSENETLNSAEIIGKILDHAKGTIALSQEDGHSVTDAGSASGNSEYDEFEKDFLSNFRV